MTEIKSCINSSLAGIFHLLLEGELQSIPQHQITECFGLEGPQSSSSSSCCPRRIPASQFPDPSKLQSSSQAGEAQGTRLAWVWDNSSCGIVMWGTGGELSNDRAGAGLGALLVPGNAQQTWNAGVGKSLALVWSEQGKGKGMGKGKGKGKREGLIHPGAITH